MEQPSALCLLMLCLLAPVTAQTNATGDGEGSLIQDFNDLTTLCGDAGIGFLMGWLFAWVASGITLCCFWKGYCKEGKDIQVIRMSIRSSKKAPQMWEEKVDEAGRKYFHNPLTGETKWD
jgi:hypothetical protein